MSNILKGLSESSLADQMMALAKKVNPNATVRLAGTPEQERERTQQMMAQRAKDREEQARQVALNDARNLLSLKTEYKQMKDRYEKLGGNNWQYADREQNLSDGEREARSMEPELNRLSARIHAAEKVITKEMDAELDENKEADYGDDYQDMVKRVGQMAKEGPRKTVYDPVKRVYKTVPVNTPKKEEGVAEGVDELYGLRIGDTVKAEVNGQVVQGDIIDIFPDSMEVELSLRGAGLGKTVVVDVRDTESLGEGQIYMGGNKPAGIRWYKPRSAPNQNELNKESAIMKGLQLEGNDEEHHTGGSLGTPYPGTYEQERKPFKSKGQRRTLPIAFEDKE